MIDPIVKVKVENGVVIDAYLLWEIPPHMESWITAPIEVGPGWNYSEGVFSPPMIEG